MNCAYCNATIDDDSAFCDQCGEEVKLCETCGRPGKGKRCINDGGKLVPASERTVVIEGSPQAAPAPEPPHSAQRASGSTPASSQSSGAPEGTIELVNENLGIQLAVSSGDTIGRSNGEHAAVLGSFPMISGTHARIERRGEWTVVDLGSTNGTYVDGNELSPNAPAPLRDHTLLKFANVEFVVRINSSRSETGQGQTMRM